MPANPVKVAVGGYALMRNGYGTTYACQISSSLTRASALSIIIPRLRQLVGLPTSI